MVGENLFSQMNKIENLRDLTDLEKKHVPVIEDPDSVKAGEPFDVVVEVGKLLKHPNEPGHHIQWVALYQGDLLVAKVDFTPVVAEPKVKLTITLEKSTNLVALERCNLHGEWEFCKEIAVE